MGMASDKALPRGASQSLRALCQSLELREPSLSNSQLCDVGAAAQMGSFSCTNQQYRFGAGTIGGEPS